MRTGQRSTIADRMADHLAEVWRQLEVYRLRGRRHHFMDRVQFLRSDQGIRSGPLPDAQSGDGIIAGLQGPIIMMSQTGNPKKIGCAPISITRLT